ncbi:MAG: hypothetical protein MJ175_12675, partial [Clostridia bacterium]|nr:hypothetical protein [Clostridia bacterium]
MNQNQYPNRGNRPQQRTGQNGQQVPNGVRRSAAPDPRREAARRAYYAKRRRQKRRARIILAVSLVLVLALFAFLVFMIVKGIRAAFSDGKPNVPADTGKTPVISEQIGTDQTQDTIPAVIGTDTEAAPGTEVPVQPDTPQTEPPQQPDTPATEPPVQTEAPETTELIGPPAPPKVEENDEPVYQLDFKADLSDFEKYMDPEDRDAYLVLVNADHPLGANDAPDDLVD